MDPEPLASSSDAETMLPAVPASHHNQTDFYKVLGVSRNSSMKDITAAYQRLASVHHPDKNFDNPKAAEIYRQVNQVPNGKSTLSVTYSQAYHVLSDANRRHQYDLSGTVAAERDYEGVDVQSLGNVGRVFGAVLSQFGGAAMPTQISPEVLRTAKQYTEYKVYCRNPFRLFTSIGPLARRHCGNCTSDTYYTIGLNDSTEVTIASR